MRFRPQSPLAFERIFGPELAQLSEHAVLWMSVVGFLLLCFATAAFWRRVRLWAASLHPGQLAIISVPCVLSALFWWVALVGDGPPDNLSQAIAALAESGRAGGVVLAGIVAAVAFLPLFGAVTLWFWFGHRSRSR
jgi:hypothetical protein